MDGSKHCGSRGSGGLLRGLRSNRVFQDATSSTKPVLKSCQNSHYTYISLF